MAHFFNRQEADAFLEKIDGQFPGIEFDVNDVVSTTTQQYIYSYIALVIDHHCFVTFDTPDGFDLILKGASLLTRAVADEQQSREYPQGMSFVDQNGLTVQQGGVYGVDERGDLYDIEPVERFRPSEY